MTSLLQHNLEAAAATLQSLAPLESQIAAAAQAVSSALLAGHKLMACGNGGSAADASHLSFRCSAKSSIPMT